MGSAIATRLAGVGHEMMVWNRSRDKAQKLGFHIAESPQRLASSCETVISMLTDAAAVQSVYEELLSADVKGKLFIEMSTVRPSVQKDVFKRVKQTGASFVECPVGGTVGPAKEGKLIGFAGGEPADFARAKPILESLCRRLEHVGPVGAGASMKLAINLPLLVYWQALGEALSLCQPLGLDPQRLMDIFADTSGAPNVLKARGGAIAQALAGEFGPTAFDIDSVRKDLRTMIEEARSLGRALPLTERALQCYDEASRRGLGGKDQTALPASWVLQSK